jgi:hypothetical protein
MRENEKAGTGRKEMLDPWQKKLLELMIRRYERTSTYRGENVLRQNIAVEPAAVFPGYCADSADVVKIAEFEKSMLALETFSPVRVTYKDRRLGGEFRDIRVSAADVEPALYQLTGKIPKRELHAAEIPLYERYREKDPLLGRFCEDQISLLRSDHESWFKDSAEDVLKLTLRILRNRRDMLVREISIQVFGDTKALEKEALLRKVLRILRAYGSYEFSEEDFSDPREYDDAILGEYDVFRNPTYVNFSGNGEIVFDNGSRLELKAGIPVAVRSDAIARICHIRMDAGKFMTVENLTSYNRLAEQENAEKAGAGEDIFYVYLAGYHNKARQDFLVRVREENPGIRRWYHFGDIDPDGFYILENLRAKTGIDFQPFRMGTAELIAHRKYCRKLNENDRVKAEHLLAAGRYPEVMRYMLDNDCKLEQEILSLPPAE